MAENVSVSPDELHMIWALRVRKFKSDLENHLKLVFGHVSKTLNDDSSTISEYAGLESEFLGFQEEIAMLEVPPIPVIGNEEENDGS